MWLSLAASNAEAVVGDMRDGAEHHESIPDALMHRAAYGTQHAHVHDWSAPRGPDEHSSVAPGAGHGPRSGHDHCFHVHGMGIPAQVALHFTATVTTVHSAAPEPALGLWPPVQPYPPRV